MTVPKAVPPHVPFTLKASTRNSDAWGEVKKHLTSRLDELRKQNDSTTNDERQTAQIRGRIAEVKRLLDLDQEPNLPPK